MPATHAEKCAHAEVGLQDLPDELLLQIFSYLSVLGPSYENPEDPWFISQLPFKNQDRDDMPHPGLRSYPFLGQVCKRWEGLLRTSIAQRMLWDNFVVDFGHELVTSIHTPLKWSNRRPSSDEFTAALNATTLSVGKIMDFVRQRRSIIQSLALVNSEGFWGDEGEYLSLANKHNFQPSHLGYLVGVLSDRLQEIALYNCNDLIATDQGLWPAVATCPQLRRLSVEGLNCRISTPSIAHLSALTKLECLTLTGEEHMGQWIVGLDSLPPSWSSLCSLHTLVLRGHQLLDTLPPWLASLPNLTNLDVSNNANLNISGITNLTRLSTLCLQHLDLSQAPSTGEAVSQHAKRVLPDLSPLAKSLTALSLAHNHLTRLPTCVAKLTELRILDVNGNLELTVPSPLSSLVTALHHIRICDFRGVHHEDAAYWSTEKCTTMEHLASAAKQVKRRRYDTRFLLDKE